MPHRQFSACWIVPVQSLRIGREERVPESSNHSLFPGNEGKFGGNQLPDGSIRLSPLRRRPICPSISKRAFAKVSPDFVFSGIFRGFPRVHTYALTQTTRKITVDCRCVCVCVHVCVCAWKNTEKPEEKEKCVWNVCVV